MRTFTEVIDSWPSLGEFAEDIGADYGTAKKMRSRDSIAAPWWPQVTDAARLRGIEGVTLDLLAKISANKRNLRSREASDAA